MGLAEAIKYTECFDYRITMALVLTFVSLIFVFSI